MNKLSKVLAGCTGIAFMTGTLLAQSYSSGQQPAQSGAAGAESSQPYAAQPYGIQRGEAQQQNESQRPSQGIYTSNWQNQRGHFCNAKQLLGREVKDPQGRSVGQINDLAFNPRNGEAFAIIGIGNGEDAAVPVQALNTGKAAKGQQLTVNTTKQEIEKGPLVKEGQWRQELNSPGFANRLYSHYNLRIQPGTEVGMVVIEEMPARGASQQ